MKTHFPRKIFNWYFHGKRNSKKVALTFDDGPSKETEKVLDILKKEGVPATFFIWGERIRGREKTIKKGVQEGHEIGSHSYSHKRLGFSSRGYIKKDLIKNDAMLKKLGVNTDLFRAPGFSAGSALFSVCRKLNKKVIFCDTFSNDWKKVGVKESVKKVLEDVRGGSIISLHDYLEGVGRNREIVHIIKKIIPELKERGFKFVTVSEIIR